MTPAPDTATTFDLRAALIKVTPRIGRYSLETPASETELIRLERLVYEFTDGLQPEKVADLFAYLAGTMRDVGRPHSNNSKRACLPIVTVRRSYEAQRSGHSQRRLRGAFCL